MTGITFCKFQGFGNDYIVIEKRHLADVASMPDFANAICSRHVGAGSDGIATIEKLNSRDADFQCEIINPDGSVAAFSGNGTRCAVAYLYYKKIWTRPELRLKTASGIKNYNLIETLSDGHYRFEAEIGEPAFASGEIPLDLGPPTENVIERPITVGKDELKFSAINVGNPVACVFVDDFDLDWRGIGKEFERLEAFPERTNVVFVKVIDRNNIEIRIWERGAGETSASGTCASGAAVLSAFTCRTERAVSVQSEGGVTEVFWRDGDEILLTGRADLVYCGEWPR
jgi:diaminopimelate epimerase